MKTLLVNNHTKYITELLDFLPGEKVVISKEELKEYKLEGFDLLVLSGGSDVPTVLRHPELYSDEMKIVKTFDGAVLGICLGSEILVAAYDGRLTELALEHRGEIDIIFIEPETLIPVHMTVQEAHGIGIDTVPSEFEVIAYSDHSPEIIKHETRPILGLQFHPELTHNAVLTEWIFDHLFPEHQHAQDIPL